MRNWSFLLQKKKTHRDLLWCSLNVKNIIENMKIINFFLRITYWIQQGLTLRKDFCCGSWEAGIAKGHIGSKKWLWGELGRASLSPVLPLFSPKCNWLYLLTWSIIRLGALIICHLPRPQILNKICYYHVQLLHSILWLSMYWSSKSSLNQWFQIFFASIDKSQIFFLLSIHPENLEK